jgi:psp operon transcriptional activator
MDQVSSPGLPPLIGSAPAILDLLERVSRAAPLDRPVLVVGERGTGKELIAARLHYLSPRWNRPYFKMNCGALAESLLESELFGHEAGAFTGAVRRRLGRFEAAHGGTLFLDEIAEANLAVQEKLLRAVEYGEFERVGGNATVAVDVRLIGATNVDLRARTEDGRFRADLLDRLSFDVLTVPPLRARRDDIAHLADHFGRAMAHELGWSTFPGFIPTAIARLETHEWPGNVRELRNVVERAVYRADAGGRVADIIIDPFDSPYRPAELAIETPSPPGTMRERGQTRFDAKVDFIRSVDRFEKRLLQEALAANRFNQRAAAAQLKLGYSQLRHLLRKHGLLGAARTPGA